MLLDILIEFFISANHEFSQIALLEVCTLARTPRFSILIFFCFRLLSKTKVKKNLAD